MMVVDRRGSGGTSSYPIDVDMFGIFYELNNACMASLYLFYLDTMRVVHKGVGF